MRGVGLLAVAAVLALASCGGGGSGSSSPTGPNAQEPNLVVVTDGLTPLGYLGHIGVDNQSGESIVDLRFHRAGAPFEVAPFEPEGGWIPDESGWQAPFGMAGGFYDVRATTETGRVLYVSFVFDPGVLDAALFD